MVASLDEKIAGIEGCFGKSNLMGNRQNVEVWCPACADKSKSKKKLSIKLENAFYHCWVCNLSGRHAGTIAKKYGLPNLEGLLKVFPKVSKDSQQKIVDERPPPKLPVDFQLLATAPDVPDVRALKNYLKGRGLTDDDNWYYKFGYSRTFKWSRRVIMPSFDDEGRLNYFTARAIDKEVPVRYMTAEADRTQVIFNEINVDWKKRLVLCEGPFDSVKCGSNVVPLLGNSLNENSALFCNIVLHGTPIAMALDSDMRVRTLQLIEKFSRYGIESTVVNLGKFKDPGEMTKDQFQTALKQAQKLDWKDTMFEKIERASQVRLSVKQAQ